MRKTNTPEFLGFLDISQGFAYITIFYTLLYCTDLQMCQAVQVQVSDAILLVVQYVDFSQKGILNP